MNINLNQEQEKYIAHLLASGHFPNASEVIHDALHLHELFRNGAQQELRTEIDKGWDATTSNRTVKDIINAKVGN